jgi:hypothetical protein
LPFQAADTAQTLNIADGVKIALQKIRLLCVLSMGSLIFYLITTALDLNVQWIKYG